MNHVAGGVDSSSHNFIIHENLNARNFSDEEAKVDLIQAWCNRNNSSGVLLPYEVIEASVNALDLPGNCVACADLS